jgi:hypothetical protein
MKGTMLGIVVSHCDSDLNKMCTITSSTLTIRGPKNYLSNTPMVPWKFSGATLLKLVFWLYALPANLASGLRA